MKPRRFVMGTKGEREIPLGYALIAPKGKEVPKQQKPTYSLEHCIAGFP